MFTRQDYLDHKCDHNTYYGQFVNGAIKALIKRRIGLDNLIRSKDQNYFNDVPLRLWDVLSYAVLNAVDTAQLKAAGEARDLMASTCIAKVAGRQLVAESRETVDA